MATFTSAEHARLMAEDIPVIGRTVRERYLTLIVPIPKYGQWLLLNELAVVSNHF
jgi:hypothetical protein